MPEPGRPRVLYVVYWGAAEPLGQSLVLPAVSRLAAAGAEITLLTFEKPADLLRRDEMARIASLLKGRGVRWKALRYHKRPRVPATAFDIARGWLGALHERVRGRVDVVHARTYVGGLIGALIAPVLGARLIYHNEGFYPDEQVDAGVWREGSLAHRFARGLERQLYGRADAVIVLSQRARAVVEAVPAVRARRTPVIVVPSCVDLERFVAPPARPVAAPEGLRLVYMGGIGGRYLFERVAAFAATAAQEVGPVRLRVLTHSDHVVAEGILACSGLPRGAWSVARVPHAQVPEELAGQQAGLHFLARGLSEHGGSPTKIGEYWASGLPVVTTPNLGDTEAVIRSERVGVVVSEHSPAAYRLAARQLRSLLSDAEVRARCRCAAETHYGLGPACERQMGLYGQLSRPAHEASAGTLAAELGPRVPEGPRGRDPGGRP